jgi:hypothetical protein
MTWFKKKPRKTMENMRPGLPVILKKFQIHAYLQHRALLLCKYVGFGHHFLLWDQYTCDSKLRPKIIPPTD